MKKIYNKGGIFPALFLFTVFALSIFKIKSYDLWWHIKAGELAVGAGFKPAPTNIFSWTEPDYPWVNFSWLFDVIVHLIHKTAGFNGLIIFQAALVTAVFFLVYKTISSQSENPPQSPFAKGGLSFFPSLEKKGQGRFIIITALFLIAYFAARFRFSLRPHLLALLFFAIDIYLLKRLSASSLSLWERAGVRVPLLLIPFLQILWANIHGSAILGVLLPGIFFVGFKIQNSKLKTKNSKPDTSHVSRLTFYILLLTLFASLVNPYGYKVLTQPFAPFFGQGADLFNTLTVDEWQMPDKDMFLGWYGLLPTIGVVSFVWSFVETPRRGVSTDLLLFASFAILSIKAVRFIDLFAVVAVPIIYKNVVSGQLSVAGSQKPENAQSFSAIHYSLFTVLILALFWFIGVKDTTFTLGLGVDNEVIPTKAVEFMEKNRIEGKIFNSYNSGGYLIYKGYPVFMDGRLCYSPAIVKEFANANMTPFGWKEVEGKYRPEIVMIEYDKPAIPEALIRDKQDWALVYWDDLTMLFLRRDERFSGIISKNEYRYLNPMNMYGLSPILEPGVGAYGNTPLQSSERNSAIFSEAQRRLMDGPESMRAHLLLGNLYLTNNGPDKAAQEYTSVLDSPATFGKAEAHNNLGTAYQRVGDEFEAEKEYLTAIRLDSVYPLPQRNLGYLALGQSRNIEALWHLNRYLHLDEGDRETLRIVSSLKRYRDLLILRIFVGGFAILGILWVVARRVNK